ncbi:MAG: tetratricopeptide (TPR) repeat protein [Psychromonas sp.]|jgi:tetratricopeptide (TPR) repeat protein
MKNLIITLTCFYLIACSSITKRSLVDNTDPNEQVTRIFTTFHEQTDKGMTCHPESTPGQQNDCEGLLKEAMQLYTAFPNNEKAQMLNAFLFYEHGRREQATFLLDQLLQQNKPRPEAAIMRSKMAMEEGNLNLAQSILLQQINQNPIYSELHETLAAVYYLKDDYVKALQALSRAEQFGAPDWRVSFHRGLVFENQGLREAACLQYLKTSQIKSDFLLATSRIFALSDIPVCLQFEPFIRG